MSTVIFDFDSTLINCESLEVILAPTLASNPQLFSEFHKLTELGMNGEITFQQSLQKRLQLAAPTQLAVQQFASTAIQYLTQGMATLIQALHDHHVEVWIMSGGLMEAITPVAQSLGIPQQHVLAVTVNWDDHGNFAGIRASDLCSQSKVLAAKRVSEHWQAPSIMVGDGMTDYAVYEAGLSEHFIAYTEHAKRPAITALATPTANNVQRLRQILQKLLNFCSSDIA